MLRSIWALAIKEFLALLKDTKGRFVIISPPIIQLLIYGYAASFDLNNIPYVIYNEDPGFASRELLGKFQGSPTFQLVDVIYSENHIAELINRKKTLLIIHIDRNFTRDLLSKRPATVQVIIDGRNSNSATVAQNYVNSILLSFNQYWANKYNWGNTPARLNIRSWFNPNLLSRWFFVSGMIPLLMMLITLLITGLSVAREREQGTFDQLLVTPMTPLSILIGKSLPAFIISMAEGIVISTFALFWFNIPFLGSLFALTLGMFVFILAAIGIGLMISSLATTQQQGLLGVFLFLTPSIILSGFATPIANMPDIIQNLTLINPLRYALIIARGVLLQGNTLSNLWPQFWPMILIALFSMTAAAWLFRRNL